MATTHKPMSATGPAGDLGSPAEVAVWDPLVRVFHWSLVVLFVGAYATGDEGESVHIMIGYALAGLIGIRVVWGLIGTKHARFSDFVAGPTTVIGYLRDVAMLRAKRTLGHNPAGGVMIVALLVALMATCATGYLMAMPQLWGAKWVEEVHEACADVTVGLVIVHVGGVILSSLLHGENLVKAMITGRKRAE